MKKSLIALAVGAAFLAPAAYADVTLSGAINAGVAMVKDGDGSSAGTTNTMGLASTGGAGQTRTGIETNYSNFSISSKEDLGGGLKLDFGLQITANFQDNSAGAIHNRNSHLGLTGDSWGGIYYGTNENLYEAFQYSNDPLDAGAGMGSNLQMMATPGYSRVFEEDGHASGEVDFYHRTNHTVWYNSPNFGGVTFGLYTSLSAYKPAGGVGLNPHLYGIGAQYASPDMPFKIFAAYESHKDYDGLSYIQGQTVNARGSAVTGTADKAFEIGAGYTFGDVYVNIIWEQLKYAADGLSGATDISEYKRNALNLNVKVNIPTGYLAGEIVKAQSGKCTFAGAAACDASNTGAWMLGLAYYHTLSKQTQAYIMGTYIKNDDLATYQTAGFGGPAAPGAKIQGATIGMKHVF